MCGIVGYVGAKPIVPLLLEGLKRLEYRGYDSAGLVVLDEGDQLQRVRAVGKIKALQLELDKTRIRTEAEIQVAQRELHELIRDEKAELGAIESKLKQGADLEVGLHLASIRARRDAMALLTPEQREKEKAEHDKMIKMRKEHRKGAKNGKEPGMGQGMKPGAEHSGPMH